jgi:hypothetical protein
LAHWISSRAMVLVEINTASDYGQNRS